MQSSTPSKVMILNLVIEFIKIRDVDNVKLSLCEKSLCMKLSTILFMFELVQCVEHIYFDLCQYINITSDKFKHFVIHLRQNCINNKSDAIDTLHRIYDKNSYIECELIIYAVDNIVYNALHEK